MLVNSYGPLRVEEKGLSHPKFGNDLVRWDEIMYVDYREIRTEGAEDNQILIFTFTPSAMQRLNTSLPWYKRVFFPSVTGNTLGLSVSNEIEVDTAHGAASGEKIFNEIARHVPERPRVEGSGLEQFAEMVFIGRELTTAKLTPRPPRSWKDGIALIFTAISIIVALALLLFLFVYLVT